jgi:hypothetical protein
LIFSGAKIWMPATSADVTIHQTAGTNSSAIISRTSGMTFVP